MYVNIRVSTKISNVDVSKNKEHSTDFLFVLIDHIRRKTVFQQQIISSSTHYVLLCQSSWKLQAEPEQEGKKIVCLSNERRYKKERRKRKDIKVKDKNAEARVMK